MIVRRVRVLSLVTGRVVSDHAGIRVGADYPVLEVLAKQDKVLLRLPDQAARPGDYETPGLWAADMFAVVSDRIPSCWTARLADGLLPLTPREWQRAGFWEDYLDHGSAVVAEHDRLQARIVVEGWWARIPTKTRF